MILLLWKLLKNVSTKANKESAYQKNATIEPAMSISLIFTTQRTPISGDIKASQSQVLSTFWASTPKLHFVSSISLEVTKWSPTASNLLHCNQDLNCQQCHCIRQRMKSFATLDQSLCIHLEREVHIKLLLRWSTLKKPSTSIKDEFTSKLIRATTTNNSATNTIIST